jgi:hypothetical protein
MEQADGFVAARVRAARKADCVRCRNGSARENLARDVRKPFSHRFKRALQLCDSVIEVDPFDFGDDCSLL